MEKDRVIDQNITERTKQAIAKEYGCPVEGLEVVGVNGGYSRNRRSLVRVGDEWIFAKEVDLSLLPEDGTEELGWLKKDHEVTRYLDGNHIAIAPEWIKLVADGHVLLLPSYRDDNGWTWELPKGQDQQARYIDAVVNATKVLESKKLDDAAIEQLNAKPFLRDEIAFDEGFALLLANEAIREQVSDKYRSLVADDVSPHLEPLLRDMISLLDDAGKLQKLAEFGRRLVDQPNDCFGHCDVRSDNIAYNPVADEVKFVDWNWASMTPKGFGATEFLTDMARRGIDVSPWLSELNPELLAATVGFYARRCIKDPFMPGSTLRDMQAESGAIAYSLYRQVTGE
jgi:hypothetical protein